MKKAMKNILNVTLAAMMVLSVGALASCGEKEPPKPAGKTHDRVTLQVTGKDTFEPHNFVNGKCKMCDETTTFTQTPLSTGNKDILTNACDQQGRVEELKYTYNSTNGNTYEKVAYVYLPYGYDADTTTKYDVVYMLHGKGLNEGYWFAQGSYKPTDGIYTGGFGTQNVLDTLMKEGKSKKAICVSPTYYLVSDGTEPQDNNFGEELTKVVMPLVAEKYRTYAADNTDASLKANRDHQAYVGLSLGSMYSFQYILSDYVDYFSYVGSFSGSTFGEDGFNKIADGLNGKFKDCKLKYWYVGIGSSEDNTTYPGDPFTAYRTIVSKVSYLKPGSDIKAGNNCMYMLSDKTGHNYATWITCLYNCMQVFFQA